MTTALDKLAQKLSRAIQDERYWGDRTAGYYKHQREREFKAKYESAVMRRLAIEVEIRDLKDSPDLRTYKFRVGDRVENRPWIGNDYSETCGEVTKVFMTEHGESVYVRWNDRPYTEVEEEANNLRRCGV